MHIGERIKEIRIARNMKQSDLAKEAATSRVAIGNYERGERQPTVEIALRIASALGVTVIDLVSNRDYETCKESAALEGLQAILKFIYDKAEFKWRNSEGTDNTPEYDGDFDVLLVKDETEILLSKQTYSTLLSFVCKNIPLFIQIIEESNPDK